MAGENRNGVVEMDFGDGTHRFRLAMGELEELQEKTGVGPFALFNRLSAGDWSPADVREPLRLGLIGGGMEPIAALALVRRYVVERSAWIHYAGLARIVVLAAISGAPEEIPGKGDAPEAVTEASNSPADASPSAPSTEPPPSAESDIPTTAA
jgi:hypothetical protein